MKRSLWIERDKNSAQRAKTFNLDDLEVAATRTKSARTIGRFVKKVAMYTGWREETSSEAIVHSVFDDNLRGKRLPEYSELSMDMNKVSCLCVLNCRDPMGFCGQETDKRYEHVTPFYNTFHV